MKSIWKGIAKVLFYAISAALLVYAAARSLDFVTKTLPSDQQIIGYLALAATSGGAIAWLMVFMYAAHGTAQKVISGLMVAIDLLGEFTLFTFDTLLSSGEAGMIGVLTAEEIRVVILGMSALIAANILATFAYHLFDPDITRNMREAAVRDELEEKALQLIERRGTELANTLAPKLAEQWMQEFQARFTDIEALGLGKFHKPVRKPSVLAIQEEEEEFSPNGGGGSPHRPFQS